jgi:putative aldouronate transport system permease protein
MLYIRRSRGEVAFDVVNALLLVLLCAATLYPFLYVVSRSLMSDTERADRPFALVPREIDVSAYQFILSRKSLLYTAYGVTIFRTVVGTALAVLVEACLSRRRSWRRWACSTPCRTGTSGSARSSTSTTTKSGR